MLNAAGGDAGYELVAALITGFYVVPGVGNVIDDASGFFHGDAFHALGRDEVNGLLIVVGDLVVQVRFSPHFAYGVNPGKVRAGFPGEPQERFGGAGVLSDGFLVKIEVTFVVLHNWLRDLA